MRAIVWSALVALAMGANIGWAQDSVKPGNAIGLQAQGDAPAATSLPAGAEKPQGETWRYRKHQGLWWYWLPSNTWVYWTDGHWTPYDAESYAKFNAARRPPTSSYSGGGNQGGTTWGQWGPVRYNQWGQRQYPYSQRSSGLQQLGPVPAAGGVRSLPGWGGER